MANPVCDVSLSEEPIGEPKAIVDLACGAEVVFRGIVRQLEDGREIEGIEYEAHQIMAEHQLLSIAQRALARSPLRAVLIHHRIGFVPAGEASLLVCVSSGHRAEAFDASRWMVDELKKSVPIWKQVRYKIDNHTSGLPLPIVAEVSA
ncbi:MAG: molybdenum cofactor biosynthesis protein MoaE [Spartobacteria bacterium]